MTSLEKFPVLVFLWAGITENITPIVIHSLDAKSLQGCVLSGVKNILFVPTLKILNLALSISDNLRIFKSIDYTCFPLITVLFSTCSEIAYLINTIVRKYV